MTTMRHYGTFRNEEVIILGYKKSMNPVMICRLTMFPADEQSALRQIASSTFAQDKCDYLIPVLQTERHKSGTEWFTYLASRLHRNDGSVSVLPLKEVDISNPEQKAFFKGYGKTIQDAKQHIGEQEERLGMGHQAYGDSSTTSSASLNVYDQGNNQIPAAAVDVPAQVTPPVDINGQMLQLLAQMSQGQQAMAESIANLATKIEAPAPKATVKAAPKKRVTRKKAAPKKVAASSEKVAAAPSE